MAGVPTGSRHWIGAPAVYAGRDRETDDSWIGVSIGMRRTKDTVFRTSPVVNAGYSLKLLFA